MRSLDELLAEFLEEPKEVLGLLADIVRRGRMRADDLEHELVEVLTEYDLVAFLLQRSPRRPVETWVYPSPLGLRVFAALEREAEREAAREAPKRAPRGKRRRGAKGSTR